MKELKDWKLFKVLEDFQLKIFQILQCFENISKTLQDQPSFETGLGDFPEPNFLNDMKFLMYLKDFDNGLGYFPEAEKT